MASLRICISVLSLVVLSFALSEAKDILVGGKKNSWTVDSSKSLNEWAQKKRFRVGDRLKWEAGEGVDPVLQVSKEDYDSCNTRGPVKDNVVDITLDQAGPFYFISGSEGDCNKGLKLIVVVMSHKHEPQSPAPAPAAGPGAPPPSDSAAAHGLSFSAAGVMGFAIAGLVGTALI